VAQPKHKITNEQFITEYNKPANKDVINFYVRKFGPYLDREEQKSCGMVALWQALSIFNPSKGRLVTVLGKCVANECRKLSKANYKFYKNHCTTIIGNIANKESVINHDYSKTIDTIISSLSPTERDIVKMKFLENHTYDEIGLKYKLTKQRIQQILSSTMDKLRQTCGV
jgi:RNA polymerase sigma factor (sigma-70 family)